MPLTILDNKAKWSLQHLEYNDGDVLAVNTHEIAKDLITRLVTTFRKYNMTSGPTKNVWMHVGGGEVLETLTVEDERIARVQRVTCAIKNRGHLLSITFLLNRYKNRISPKGDGWVG